jgi:putative FmdB family regulatory protein
MPTYVYRCSNCGDLFELNRSIKDRDKKSTCPKCNKRGVRTVLSASIIFNGGGFYKTDNRKK